MSSINKNWGRWCFASICKHFDGYKGSLPMFIEGQYRQTEAVSDFLELRIDGPNFTEINRGLWRIFVEINVLVQSAMNDTNFHNIHSNAGIASAAFTDGISVYKYGGGVDDDGSLLVCLNRVDDARGKERVQVSHFGKIDPDTPLLQATVEGHYEGFIKL